MRSASAETSKGDHLLIIKGRDHDRRGARPGLAHAPEHLQAVHARQHEVQQQHVRVLPLQQRQGLRAVGRRADDLHVALRLQRIAEQGAVFLPGVGDQDLDFSFHNVFLRIISDYGRYVYLP